MPRSPGPALKRPVRALALAAFAALLASCAGGPPPPVWQANAHAALNSHESAYLKGDTRIAASEFARARSEISRSGRGDLLARAELVRCAAQVASLEFDDCPGYLAHEADAGAQERAYAAYLSGRWQGLDAAQLPAHHRTLPVSGPAALAGVDDPLARLIAAGALLRAGRIDPAGIAGAVNTASANGWRRPLLAWLGVQAKRAEDAGDREAAADIRRRMAIAGGEAPGR